jgi:aspartate/methionine/tyrosine aminotransferase
MTSRATVYLDTRLYHAAKVKAAHTDSSLSKLVNDALRSALKEDQMDLDAIEKRRKEPVRSLQAVLKGLKRDGLL